MNEPDEVVAAYDRWAATYDVDDNRTRDLDAQVVQGWLADLHDRDVFEFGAGTGKNTVVVADVARSLTSVDVSPGMLDRARARPGTSAVTFVQLGPDDDWPVAPASVDVVMTNLVLEHLPKVAAFFERAARTVRPGGLVLVSELHPERQQRGSRARGAGDLAPPCFLHPMDEYLAAARATGLVVEERDEPVEPDAAPDAPPRLVVWRLRRPTPTSSVPSGGECPTEEHTRRRG